MAKTPKDIKRATASKPGALLGEDEDDTRLWVEEADVEATETC